MSSYTGYYSHLDPARVEEAVERFEVELGKLCSPDATGCRKSAQYICSTLEDDMQRHAMVRVGSAGYTAWREPTEHFFPGLTKCVVATKKLAQKSLILDSPVAPRMLVSLMAAHSALGDVLYSRKVPKELTEAADLFYRELVYLEQMITSAVVAMSEKEISEAMWGSLDPLSERSYNSHWDTVPAKAVKKWLGRVPYGRQGAKACVMLLEIRTALRGVSKSWERIITDLIDEKDTRRGAELLLWHATQPVRSRFSPEPLKPDEMRPLLRKCADGVPPSMVWEILNDPNLAAKAAEEAQAASQPGYELEGKWVYGSSSYTIDRRDGVLMWGERVYGTQLEGELKPARVSGVTRVPAGFPAQWVAVLNNGGAIFIRTMGQHALESVYKDDVNSNHQGVRCIATRSVEAGRDTVCSFASRLLQGCMAAPPEDGLVENLKQVFQHIPQLPDTFIKHLDGTISRCYPRSLVRLFQALPGDINRIVGPNGFLRKQAQHHPCTNLVAVVGHVMENNMGLSPEDAVAIMRDVALREQATSDPAGLLWGQAAVSRSDFDGVWDWLRGYRDCDYLGAISVQGNLVRIVHPDLASARVMDVTYGPDLLDIKLSIRSSSGTDWTADSQQAMTANNAELAQDQTLHVGDRVRVRDHDTGDWKLGIVTKTPDSGVFSREETLVRADGWGTPYNWVYCQKVIAPPPAEGTGGTTQGSWTSVVTVRMYRYDEDTVYGWWKTSYGEKTPSEFVRRGAVSRGERQSDAFGALTSGLIASQLEEWVTRKWDPRGCSRCGANATELVEQIVNGDNVEKDLLLPTLWDWVINRIVRQHFRFVSDLDSWVLGGEDGLDSLTGVQKSFASGILTLYFQEREVSWQTAPINLKKAEALAKCYGKPAEEFLQRAKRAMVALQENIDKNMLTRAQVLEFERHKTILEDNGVKLNASLMLDEIAKELRGVEHTTAMLRELVDRWGVTGADKLLSQLEETLRQRDLTPLATITQLHLEVRTRLGPALEHADAATSPLLRAHFLHLTGGRVSVKDFPKRFDKVLKHLASLSINTPVVEAVANLSPPEGDYAEGRRDQEQRLLTAIGCDEAVVEALLNGALPLRLAVHDLGAFRTLARNPPSAGLRLHDHFFDAGQEKLLLELDADVVPLCEALSVLKELQGVAGGCEARVLRLIKAVLQCGALVDFVRRHPETQDTGLANVLANARDKQHADFQTFLESCTYINPFVAASAAHAALVDQQSTSDDEESILLRPKICCSEFFAELQKAFAGSEEGGNMAMLEEMLLTTSEKDKLEALEALVASKTTTTDALVATCQKILNSEMVLELPPTGQPLMKCEIAGEVLVLGQYKDAVYRATLQKANDPGLATFVGQAKEVLRAYLAACSVYDEGHLEFRGRQIRFAHHDAGRVYGLLQALRGQWVLTALASKGLGADSVLVSAIRKFPVLATLSSAELVRVALLLRSTAPLETESEEDVKRLLGRKKFPWRMGCRVRPAPNHELAVVEVPGMQLESAVPVPTAPTKGLPGPDLLDSGATYTAEEKQTMKWSNAHPVIAISEGGSLATRGTEAPSLAPMALCGSRMASGVHQWEVEVLSNPSFFHVGVASPSVDLEGGQQAYGNRWTLMSDGKLWCAGDPGGSIGVSITPGDVVRLTADLSSNTLTFAVNGEQKAVGITGIRGPVCPCVVMKEPGCSVRIRQVKTESKCKDVLIVGSTCGVDGLYSQKLRTFVRGDGAVLCPTDGGWTVFKSSKTGAQQLIRSCSGHRGCLEPHQMVDWQTAKKRTARSEPDFSISVRRADDVVDWNPPDIKTVTVTIDSQGAPIKIDEKEEEVVNDVPSCEANAATEENLPREMTADMSSEMPWMANLFDDNPAGPVMLGLEWAVVGKYMVISKVKPYSLAADSGIQEGMRVLCIKFGPGKGRRGDPLAMQERLLEACASQQPFKMELVSAATWDFTSSDLQESGITVKHPAGKDSISGRMRKEVPKEVGTSLAFSPAIAREFHVRLTDAVKGTRVGAALADFDPNKPVDGPANRSRAWWYLRPGVLRFQGKDTTGFRALQPEDVVTVSHDRAAGVLVFSVNGKVEGQFNNVHGLVHPVVYLPEEGATATLMCKMDEQQATGGMRWSESTKGRGLTITGDTVARTLETDDYSGVYGEPFAGGKHALDFEISRPSGNCLFGACTPGQSLTAVFPAEGDNGWGIGLQAEEGDVYNLKTHDKVFSDSRLKFGKGDRMCLLFDFDKRSFEITKNGERIVGSAEIEGLGPLTGPLAPWAVFGGSAEGITMTLNPTRAERAPAAPAQKPVAHKLKKGDAVTIISDLATAKRQQQKRSNWVAKMNKTCGMTGTVEEELDKGKVRVAFATGESYVYVSENCLLERMKFKGHSDAIEITGSGAADGVYRAGPYVYLRKDAAAQLYYWDGRWVIADPMEQPLMWCEPCEEEKLGSPSLQWTEAEGRSLSDTPEALRMTAIVGSGVYELQAESQTDRPVWVNKSKRLELVWRADLMRWVLRKCGTDEVYMQSAANGSNQRFPHWVTSWEYGTGNQWCDEPFCILEPLSGSNELRLAEDGALYTFMEWGDKGWSDAPVSKRPEPVVSGLSVNLNVSVAYTDAVSTLESDPLSEEELCVWHIVHAATGCSPRGPALRYALSEVAGKNQGLLLDVSWPTGEAARDSCRSSAAEMLVRMGKVLERLRSVLSGDLLNLPNFDTVGVARYGPLCERTVEGRVLDISRLGTADRRVFGLALFDAAGLRPHHLLDCTKDTPPEDVHNFLVRFRELSRGRLLVNNLQQLTPDAQNEVRIAASEGTPDRELIALVTGGAGADETIEQLDARACDLQWRKWAHPRVAAMSKFKSVTYFAQGPGEGKSYAIEKTHISTHRALHPSAPVVFLDLDSASTAQYVCECLIAPLRHPKGLLVVHVAHDAPLTIVNQVLDNLVFLGRLSAPSGLTLTVHPSSWELVVELQASVEGTTRPADIHVLAVEGLARTGSLLPFQLAAYPCADEALEYLEKHTDGLQRIPREEQLRMVCMGVPPPDRAPMSLTWESQRNTTEMSVEAPAQPEEEAPIQTHVEARHLARAAKFLGTRFERFKNTFIYHDQEGAGVKEMRTLVAEAMRHAAHQFLFPQTPNHFHLRVSDDPVPTMMLMAGKVPQPIEKARAAVRGAIQQFFRSLYGGAHVAGPSTDLVSMDDKPLYSLVEMLAVETQVSEKETAALIANKGYVLIPDFLQKMVQLSEHIELRDTAILQGPSGTGKSFCVSLLASLEQLSKRHGFTGLDTDLVQFIRRGAEMKSCFPSGVSDQVGETPNVLWDAVNREDYQNVYDVLDAMCDRTAAVALRGLNIVRKALLDMVGPMLCDCTLHPEVVQKMNETDAMVMNCFVLTEGTGEDEKPEEAVKKLLTALKGIVHGLSRLGRAYLTSTVVRCVGEAIEKEVYPSVIDDERLVQMLHKDHVREGLLNWARDVSLRAGERAGDVATLIKGHVRSELARCRLLRPCEELQAELDREEGEGAPVANIIEWFLDCTRTSGFKSVLMSFDMTPEKLFEEMVPLLRSAVECPSVRFVVFIDEMNASNMMGLLKRIVVDRRWDRWEQEHPKSGGRLPDNVSFVCAVNPHKKDVALEGGDTVPEGAVPEADAPSTMVRDEDLGFDVQALPPPCRDFIVPWKQLSEDQRDLFVARRLGSNKHLFAAHLPPSQLEALSGCILTAHRFVQNHLIASGSRSTVSQRDIHRTMRIFDFLYERNHDFITGTGRPSAENWERALSAMLVSVAVSYYFRLHHAHRASFSDQLTSFLMNAQHQRPVSDTDKGFHIPEGFKFEHVVQRAVDLYCDPMHMRLPDAVFRHQGLMENLFVQLVCFHIRLGVILHGAPGTSKTLSNNIIRDNMTGRGDFMGQFAQISEVCRYQGSSQSTADEIKRKCVEAFEGQQRHDAVGRRNKRCLLFVDEAGLVGSGDKARKWGLKVLHYYLEAGLAAVLMTNDPLDPAISNRCVEVYLTKPSEEELSAICSGILHPRGAQALGDTAKLVVPACCKAFGKLMEGGSGATAVERRSPAELRWWFGLRDLFHLMRYLRRQQESSTEVAISPKQLMTGLERNFNGLPELFAVVVDTFGDAMDEAGLKDYNAIALRGMARRKLEVVSDSLSDNNRASEGAARNLNDMWVRFKLLVDTTADGSLLELLQGTGVHDFEGIQVLALSSLSADELMPVTVVSQIAAAMETGKTVWLTNTRAIDGCLFDVFNQSYQCCTNGRNQVLHFVALAIGATLEYKRVHKNFQAIVHVTRAELSPDILPAPFLNRLEKFTVGVDDILEHATHRLPDRERRIAAWVREKCGRFSRCLSVTDRCLFSARAGDTLDSVVLEAIATGRIEEPPHDERLVKDEALASFHCLRGKGAASLWRNRALRLIQLMRPEGMLLAQRVLQRAPAYVRAYFVSLSPWSLREYLRHAGRPLDAGCPTPFVWERSMVYSPDNVDFMAILRGEGHVKMVSLDALAEAERGAEDLQEEVYRFVEDDSLSVFVLIIGPSFIGQPVVREVRHLLENPPEHSDPKGRKAIVLLQAFRPSEFSASATPLFATGWDQVYIDAAADAVGANVLRYVDSSIVGRKFQSPLPTYSAIEAVIPEALAEVDAAQIAGPTVPVLEKDPAGDLYNHRSPFTQRIEQATKLLDYCPAVRQALVQLHIEHLPSAEQLVGMAQEVVARGGEAAHSLAALLRDEERKLPRNLAALALRMLLDDRNASVLLSSKDGRASPEVDRLMARALTLSIGGLSFEQLILLKVHELPPLNIGPSPPRLPGSLALAEQLPISITAHDAVAQAKHLEATHRDGPVGELVNIVHRDPALTTAFFVDSLRCRVRHQDTNIESLTVDWVLLLARAKHRQLFGGAPETVWNIRALCAVEGAAIDDFILAILPLATAGVLSHTTPVKTPTEDVLELCPRVLVEVFPLMASTKDGAERWKAAVASLCQRFAADHFRTPHLPSLILCARALGNNKVDEWKKFLEVGATLPAPHVDLKLLRDHMKDLKGMAICQVLVELAAIQKQFPSPSLLDVILEFLHAPSVTPAMGTRVLNFVLPKERKPVEVPVMAQVFYEAASKYGKKEGRKGKETLYTAPGPVQVADPDVLRTAVYTALFHCSVDYNVGAPVVALASSILERRAFIKKAKEEALRCYHSVVLAAESDCFLKSLAGAFAESESPEFLDGPSSKAVEEVAAFLLQQPNWKPPQDKGERATGVDDRVNDNNMALLAELQRVKGTKAMLEFLRDQVPDELNPKRPVGRFAKLCGTVMQYKCLNSEPLTTRPGDLPFVYTIDDPLHLPFLETRKVLKKVEETGKVALVAEMCHRLQTGGLELMDIRLLLFFTCAREYLGEKCAHKLAQEIAHCEKMAGLLQLTPRQQRLLFVFLDVRKAGSWQAAPCGLSDASGPLMRGFRDGWTEMACVTMAVAAALPDSMLHTLSLDINTIKDTYICGDKTRSPATRGGAYKFDCVTQVDTDGQLSAYARGQEIMSTGACFLLWAVEFGAMALQLLLFPDAHDAMWNHMFSGDLKTKIYAYQKGMSDHQLLIANMTERSQTIFLHLGMHVGLTVDEASRLVSLFLYHLVTDTRAQLKTKKNSEEEESERTPSNPLLVKAYKERQLSLTAEEHIEAWWKGMTAGAKTALAPPTTDLCSTLTELLEWLDERRPDSLPRSREILAAFRSTDANAAPMLSMVLNERKRLDVLPLLVKALSSFISRLYAGLSGCIPITESRRPVLDFIRECYPPEQHSVGIQLFREIRELWNRYLKTVGPIAYQCGQHGEITFEIEEEAPLSLFLTLPETDCPLPLHQNIMANALNSFIRIYNDCQAVASRATPIETSEVDPLLLNPSKPDLTLRAIEDINEICRSYYTTREHGTVVVNWEGLEAELAFRSGMLLPRLRHTVLPHFKFYEADRAGPGTLAIEEASRDLLSAHPSRHAERLTPEQRDALRQGCHKFTKEQVLESIVVLNRVFDAPDVAPTDSLYHALMRKRKDDTPLPFSPASLARACVGQTREILEIFLLKVRNCEWETADLPLELTDPLPQLVEEELNAGINEVLQSRPVAEVLEYVEELAGTLRSAEAHRLKKVPAPETTGIVDLLALDLLMDHEDVFDKIFIPVRCSQYVDLRRWLQRTARRLRKEKVDATEHVWLEEGAEVPEMTLPVTREPGEKIEMSFDEDLLVVDVAKNSPLERAGLRTGMRLLAIGGTHVEMRSDVAEALEGLGNEFDVLVALASVGEELAVNAASKEANRLDNEIVSGEIEIEEEAAPDVATRRRGAKPVRSKEANHWVKLRGHMRVLETKQAAAAAKAHEERQMAMERDGSMMMQEPTGGDEEEGLPRQSSVPTQWGGPNLPGLPRSLSDQPSVMSDPLPSEGSFVSCETASRRSTRHLEVRVAELNQEVAALRAAKTQLESTSRRQQRTSLDRIDSLEMELQEKAERVAQLEKQLKDLDDRLGKDN